MNFSGLVNFAVAGANLLSWSKKEYVIESSTLSYFGCPQSHIIVIMVSTVRTD